MNKDLQGMLHTKHSRYNWMVLYTLFYLDDSIISHRENTVSMHTNSSDNDASESGEREIVSEGDSLVECDIGKLQNSHIILQQLPRDTIYQILTTEPNSDPSSYPRTRPYPSSSLRQFQPSWVKQHPWLHYSQFLDGAFCRACALFAPSNVGGQDLGKFVTSPFRSWTKISVKANMHAGKAYHSSAITKMREFLARYQSPSQSVGTLLDTQAQRVMDANQKVIQSLFKIVILCGKQGLALRGHRDDRIQWVDDGTGLNEGNFVQLVRFRAETDTHLADHLSKAPKNACYTSKTIQNELVRVIGLKICSDILEEVKSSKFYSIIADEVTDVANKEELSLVIRFVCDDQIREVFVDFIEVERITGQVLGKAILKWLREHGISPSDMRGQHYDGASNMSGARLGVKTVVQEAAPKAMYFYCAAHRLNLSVVSACRIQAFKNAESYVGEIARFFNFSAKRQRLLDRAIEASNHSSKAKKLKDCCRTRWVERVDSYAVFLELLPALHMCLQAMVDQNSHTDLGIDWSWDGETITKATGFLYQLQSSTFLVSFQILMQFFQLLRELTIKLQMKAADVVYAYKFVTRVASTLKSMRSMSTIEFKKIFSEGDKLGKLLHGDDFQLTTPRLSGRQIHRSNPLSATPEEYYRICLYNEFLSHVIAEIEERFVNNPSQDIVTGLLYLLPSECVLLNEDSGIPEQLTRALELFKDDLPHAVMIPIEYDSWVREWRECSTPVPVTLADALQKCSALSYPNLNILLKIAMTLPITSCESERSFSQLKLIKTARRATMSESRLSALALMKMNRDHCNKLLSEENMRELVKTFAQLHPRRMKLPFMLQD